MDPLSLITGAKDSIDAAMTVAKIYKDAKGAIDEIEQNAKLLEIKSNLIDAKDNILELRSALIEKEEEIQKLQQELKQQKDVKFDSLVYWHHKENETKDGPFCQKCHDKNGKLVRLQVWDHAHEGSWKCTVCESIFETKEYGKWQEGKYDLHGVVSSLI